MGYYSSDGSEGSESKESKEGSESKEHKDLETISLISIHRETWMGTPEVSELNTNQLSNPYNNIHRDQATLRGPGALFSF